MSVSPHIQLVIPMAGLGTRFSEAGYGTPKPLLPVHGIPVYQVVLANLLYPTIGSITVIAQRSWCLRDTFRALDQRLSQKVTLIEIDHTTAGPAETVELARPVLNLDLPVVTGNSDQYVDADLSEFLRRVADPDLSGVILTMGDTDPKWSYVSLDQHGLAVRVKEKQVISEYATVGIYGFSSAAVMFNAFDLMREARDTTNGEFYVAPSYNQLIAHGARIGVVHLGPVNAIMHGLGVPADYEAFVRDRASRIGASKADALFHPAHDAT